LIQEQFFIAPLRDIREVQLCSFLATENDARGWVMAAAFRLKGVAAESQSLSAESLDVREYGFAHIHRQPIGICVMITP
jgi:hypothetical protein